MNKSLNISIIIIGYNTRHELGQLLQSINNLKHGSHILEVIYIDDASEDSSLEVFKNYPLGFQKKYKKNPFNRGRSFSTQRGINLASGDWFLFLRSNEIASKNLLHEYVLAINQQLGLAYMGVVRYQSQDKYFEQYLNNKRRGVNLFSCGEKIHYKFLLFNNSIIHKQIFKDICFNGDLKKYGGEELDFSFRLNKKFPNMICACPNAVVYRKNYPSLLDHCMRLEEFGLFNLHMLSKKLQLDIVGYKILLRKWFLLRLIVLSVYFFCNTINAKIKMRPQYLIIRAHFLAAILKGYYRGS